MQMTGSDIVFRGQRYAIDETKPLELMLCVRFFKNPEVNVYLPDNAGLRNMTALLGQYREKYTMKEFSPAAMQGGKTYKADDYECEATLVFHFSYTQMREFLQDDIALIEKDRQADVEILTLKNV